MAGESRLSELLSRASRVRTQRELCSLVVDHARRRSISHNSGIFLFDAAGRVTERAVDGVPDTQVDEYDRVWRTQDNVLAVALQRLVPAHNLQLYTPDVWARLPISRNFNRAVGIGHCLCAPILSGGAIAGAIGMCRRPGEQPFGTSDLVEVAALSAVVSAALSDLGAGEPPWTALTPREHQIARLVTIGRNNLEIAEQLGIARETVKQTLRRVYRKLDVGGRAEMAAKFTRD